MSNQNISWNSWTFNEPIRKEQSQQNQQIQQIQAINDKQSKSKKINNNQNIDYLDQMIIRNTITPLDKMYAQPKKITSYYLQKYYPSQCLQQQKNCLICLSTIKGSEQARLLVCLHCFHSECIDRWLIANQNTACPYCKTELI